MNDLNQPSSGVPQPTVPSVQPAVAANPIPVPQSPSTTENTWKTPPDLGKATPPAPPKTSLVPPPPGVVPQPSLTPPERPSGLHTIMRILIILTIGLLVFAVVIVGLVFADEKGVINSGAASRVRFINLTGWTGGLSAKPADASVQVTKALQGQHTFAFSGILHGYKQSITTSTTSTTPPAISTDSQCANGATTCDNSTVTSSGLDPLAQDTKFLLQTNVHNYSLETTINDAGIDITSEYRVVDGQLYIKNVFGATADTTSTGVTADTAAQWIKSGKALDVSIDTMSTRIGSLLAGASFIGNEKVGTESAYHFQVAVSAKDIPLISAFAVQNTTLADWQTSNGLLDEWVSRQTHLPIQLRLALTSSAKKTLTLDAKANAVNGSPSIVAPENAIDPTALLSPDQIRKADLSTIATALGKYYLERGSYPVSSGIDHLNKSDSVLNKALVPVYVDKLPQDSDASHYYGYVSDGLTYELSAVLDDINDPDITKSGNLALYLLKSPAQVDNSSVKK